MPSREAIAKAIEDASLNEHDEQLASLLVELSEDVSNMRCDTCSKHDDDNGYCGELRTITGKWFGCFSWEERQYERDR